MTGSAPHSSLPQISKNVGALIQDYDNHKNIYKPEVMDSKLISHRDNKFPNLLTTAQKKDYHRNP